MKLNLYIPALEDLWFRQELLSDPASMAYNRGYNQGVPGFHPETGCIDFPQENWPAWYARWVEAQPERFYAYLRLEETGAFLGEVNLYETAGPGVYDMGIVLHSAQRSKGYSREGIRLLLDQAFGKMGAKEVRNCFEPQRKAALRIHLGAGFQVVKEEDGLLYLSIKREAYS